MKQRPSPPPRSSVRPGHVVIALVILGAFAAVAYWVRHEAPPPAEPVASVPAAAADYSPLIGKWQRSDGDYVIEILSAAPDGKLEAKYFNPSPINVGKAMGLIDGGKLTALVELRDANYPGSTYRLRHSGNKLTGDYFQATQGETFQVEFTRLP